MALYDVNRFSIPKLSSSTSWLMVFLGVLAGIAVILLIMLSLASGYSGDFLGVWRPLDSIEFRYGVGITMLVALILNIAINMSVVSWGSAAAKVAAGIFGTPFLFLVIWFLIRLVEMAVRSFGT